MKRRALVIGLALGGLYFIACGGSDEPAAPAGSSSGSGPPKVILFIGDGLGTSQTALAIYYANIVEERKLHMQRLMEEGRTGYAMPLPHETVVTDSAAAASHMATGKRGLPEALALDLAGHPNETIVEWAEARGIATGIVTNMRLSHATPAAFAAHQGSRYDPEAVILPQILAEHEIEVLLGGGARALVPQGTRVSESLPGLPSQLDGASNREDDWNLVEEARERGYTVVSNRTALAEAAAESDRLLGLFAASHLPYVIDKKRIELTEAPALAEMTAGALAVLGRSESGFFLTVEGGRIDYAGHDNDAGSMLQELFDFDEALGVGLRFQEEHPETLVIVTADHGTGGFSFTYGKLEEPIRRELSSGAVYHIDYDYPGRPELELLGRQTASYEEMRAMASGDPVRLVEVVREHTGLEITLPEAKAVTRPGEPRTADFAEFYTDLSDTRDCLLGRALARHTYVVWSTGGHTMEPVMTYGRGPGAEELRGLYENTHVYDLAKRVLEKGRD